MRAALSLLVAIALIVGSAAVLHPDQAGKWDWYVQGIGYVNQASVHTSKANKAAYVATPKGTLAALRTRSNGDIKWRKLFAETDEFVCVADGADSVVAATKNGLVVSVDAGGGMLEWSQQLPLAEGDAVVACSSANIVVKSSTGLTVFAANEEAAKNVKNIDAAVDAVVCSESWCWMSAGSKVSAFQLGKWSVITGDDAIQGTITAVNGAFAAVQTANKAQLVKAVESKLTTKKTVECGAGCAASLLSDDTTSSLITATNTKKNTIEISMDGGDAFSVEILEVSGVAPAILAARSGKKSEVLMRTSDGHLHYVLGSALQWTRTESLSTAKFTKFGELPDMAGMAPDRFGFNELIFLQSAFGRLNALFTLPEGERIHWSTNVFADVAEKYPALSPADIVAGTVTQLLAEGDAVQTTVRINGDGYTLKYEAISGILLETSEFKKLHRSTGHMFLDTEGNTNIKPTKAHYLYEVDEAKGELRGLTVAKGASKAQETWKVNLGFPIAATTDGHNPLVVASVEALHLIPNATSKVGGQVRRKYPTHNMVAVAGVVEDPSGDSEFPTMEIVVIDTVTGSVLAKGAYENVDGPIKLLLVENVLIFHFLDVKRMRYNVGTWEMYEHENHITLESTMVTPGAVVASLFGIGGGKREVSSFVANPPYVASQILAFPAAGVSTIGVTTSFYGVARKQIIFSLTNGHVVAVPLNSLIIGGQANPKAPTGPQLTFVLIPTVQYISHIHDVQNIDHIASTPTQLESSAHAIAVGQDLFYTRMSAGKAFDLLNDDFNFELLLIVLGVFAVAAVVLRGVAKRAALNAQWA